MANGKIITINNKDYVTDNAVKWYTLGTSGATEAASLTPLWNTSYCYLSKLNSLDLTLTTPFSGVSYNYGSYTLEKVAVGYTETYNYNADAWQYNITLVNMNTSGSAKTFNIAGIRTGGTDVLYSGSISRLTSKTKTYQAAAGVRYEALFILVGGTTIQPTLVQYAPPTTVSHQTSIIFTTNSNFSLTMNPPTDYTVIGLDNISYNANTIYELNFKAIYHNSGKIIKVLSTTL